MKCFYIFLLLAAGSFAYGSRSKYHQFSCRNVMHLQNKPSLKQAPDKKQMYWQKRRQNRNRSSYGGKKGRKTAVIRFAR